MEKDTSLSSVLTASPGFLLGRSARIMREQVMVALRPVGLQPQELGLLKVLMAEGPSSQHALATKCHLDRTTVTEIVDGLEERGFVIRQTDPRDRRSKILFFTPVGRRVLTRASKAAEKAQQKFRALLSDQEWQIVQACLIRYIGSNYAEKL